MIVAPVNPVNCSINCGFILHRLVDDVTHVFPSFLTRLNITGDRGLFSFTLFSFLYCILPTERERR